MKTIVDSCKGLLKNKYIMTLVGVVVFFMIGEYGAIPTGVHDMYIYMQYPLLYMFAAIYGSIPGLIVGLVGHLLIDLVRQDVWISWITASGFMGFIIGKIYEKQKDRAKTEIGRLVKFLLICAGTIILVFGIYTPILNIIFYHMSARDALSQTIFASASDLFVTLIVVHMFYFSFKSDVIRRVIAFIVIIDSLLLLSYGNRGVGSLIVYLVTIAMCLISYLNTLVDALAKTKLKALWYGAIALGLAVVSMFAFLFVSGYVKYPKGDEQVAIVLGAGLAGDQPNSTLKKRLDKLIVYADKNPNAKIITSGGQGADEIISEALAMKNYLVANGVDENRIFLEDESTTTEENFRFSLEVMKEQGFDEATSVVIVTNDFHCFRSSKYAQAEGYKNLRTLPSATPIVLWLPNYIREIMATGKYIIKMIIGG